MIHTNRIVTVGEQESIIDRPIVLYRGDREVEIEFTLVGNEFTFSEEGNVIKSVNASHGQLVLNTPSGEHMFSELAECHEGKVVFVVTKEMIDEFIEMGFYSFQIRLYDSAEMKSRVTIPPVMNGFDIRNPIAAEDETNVVDQGIVDYARIFKDQSNEELPTFTWDGEYVKTEWAHHDVITENKINKIEDALYSINANIKESDVVMLNALDNVKKDADAYVKEHMAEVEQDVDEFERNLNTDVQQFKIDTNAAMTAHKNEVSEVVDGFDAQLAQIEKSLIVSVKDFGAKGDGVTDDTEAIQRAIYYLLEEKKKMNVILGHNLYRGLGELFFPKGVYVVSHNVFCPPDIPLNQQGFFGFNVRGEHREASILLMKETNESYFYRNDEGMSYFQRMYFLDLGFYGEPGNELNINGFDMWSNGGEKQFNFIRCKFSYMNDVFKTRGTGNADLSRIQLCDINCLGNVLTLDNQQSVSWEFSNNDITTESNVILVKSNGGSSVTFTGGTMDFYYTDFRGVSENYLVNITKSANVGEGTSYVFRDVRIELEAYIYDTNNVPKIGIFNSVKGCGASPRVILDNVSFINGTTYKTTSPDENFRSNSSRLRRDMITVINISQRKNVILQNCRLLRNFEYRCVSDIRQNIGSADNAGTIIFEKCIEGTLAELPSVNDDSQFLLMDRCYFDNETGRFIIQDMISLANGNPFKIVLPSYNLGYCVGNNIGNSCSAIVNHLSNGMPNATTNEYTFRLPKNTIIKKLYVKRNPAGSGTYKLKFGHNDKSTVIAESNMNDAKDTHELILENYLVTANMTFRIWAETAYNGFTKGIIYVDYI